MSIANLLIHRCTVARVTRPKARGGWTESWASVGTGVHCRIQPLSAAEIARYASVDMVVKYKVYFASSTVATGVTLNQKDRLTTITNASGTAVGGSPTLDIVGLYDTDLLGKLLVAVCS